MAPRPFALVSGRDYGGFSCGILVSLCLHGLVFHLLSQAPLPSDSQTHSPRLEAQIQTAIVAARAVATVQAKQTARAAEPPPTMPQEAPTFPGLEIDQRQILSPRITSEPVRISHLEDPDYFLEQEETQGDVIRVRITIPADILPADELAALRDYQPLLRIVVNELGQPVLITAVSPEPGDGIPAFLRELLEKSHYSPASINHFPVSSYVLLELRFKFD